MIKDKLNQGGDINRNPAGVSWVRITIAPIPGFPAADFPFNYFMTFSTTVPTGGYLFLFLVKQLHM
jgi:hypothetical protein